MSDETTIENEKTASDTLALSLAKQKFEKEFKERSFSGRNPTLGPMIKCAQCGLRHRDNVKHEPIKYTNKPGTSEPMVAETKRFRPVGNRFWPSRPGVMTWIAGLNKFVRLTR